MNIVETDRKCQPYCTECEVLNKEELNVKAKRRREKKEYFFVLSEMIMNSVCLLSALFCL